MASLRPSLHQLRVFETVARHRNFTRAAEELHSTQPTVSVQMRELSAAVGLPLIEQQGRRIALTPAGEALLVTARAMFDAWSAFETGITELKGIRRGTLRLAAVTTAEYFVPELLAPFARAHPGIEVRLAVENRDAVIRRLEQDLDDLAVMMMPPRHLPLTTTPFLDNPLVALAPRGHPLAARRRVTLNAFAAEPLLTREKGSGTRMASEEFFAQHGLAPNVRMELGSNEAIKHAVAAGLGVAILSAHTVGRHPARDGLAVLAVDHLPIRRSWTLVRREGRIASPVVQAFMDYLAARPASDAARKTAAARPSARRARAAR
ncbi:MAG: LysR substrate-binding domain-containing protein [Burkholderiaceae bacterium]|jgi:DNA-binding transcriptional LysR family regulator|nr:LysR substrate-binding domain-containing protein [Burkholderiaceae bacterium]